MGTPDFAVSSLHAICEAGHRVVGVVTVPDRQTGRGLKLTYSPVKQYALDHQLPLQQPERLRDPQFLSVLQSWHADLFVVVAFRMLPECVWSMPPLGTFNLHASLLPQYRGAAPINWAIINGERETGVTTFLLNHHIDEGSILLQESTPITPCPQPDTPTLKPAPKIFKPDCAIPWHLPGASIVDFVRGLSPYPAATMQMLDHKSTPQQFKVYRVAFEPADNTHVGELITDRKTYQKVGVSDGYIHILSLQLSGKKRINIDEFLRGYDVTDWKIMM